MPTTTYTRVFGEILSENRNGSEIDYVSDVQGNVLELRTANGSASDTASYWPFGSVRSHKGGTPMPYGFVGAYGVRTDATNRQHAGRRAYSSERGRFEQRDPVPSDWTRYSYGLDNPVSYADWNGAQAKKVTAPASGNTKVNPKPGRPPKSYAFDLASAIELANDLCGDGDPLACKGVNDQLPICTAGSANWAACGEAIIGPNPPFGGNANFSNWPKQKCQISWLPEPLCWIGAEYCCKECQMRVCCAFGPYHPPSKPSYPRAEPIEYPPRSPILPGEPVRLGPHPIWQ